MENKVSIIIPVYNTEYYLARCVNSVLNQTEKNIEIILVDDGSKDGSPALCDDLSKKDARIKVIHKRNGGLSSARNAGLDVATGDYVTFVDSDDWIAKDTLEYGLNLIQKHNVDAIEYEYVYVASDSDPIKSKEEKIEVFHEKEILQFYMQSTTVRGNYSVCICIFNKQVLEGVRFRVGTIAEDIEFKYRAYSNCKTLVHSNQTKYFYYQSGNSLSTGGVKQRDFQLFDVDKVLVDLTKDETYGTIKYLGEVKKARTPLSLLCRIAYWGIIDSTLDKDELVSKLCMELKSNLGLLLSSPMPISRKILALMFTINYTITEKIIYFFIKKHYCPVKVD